MTPTGEPMTETQTPPEAPVTPRPPYRPKECPFGQDGRMLAVKEYPGVSGGPLLSDEERHLWGYIFHLEAEVKRLTRELGNAIPAPPDAVEEGPHPLPEADQPAAEAVPAGKKKRTK